MKLERRSLFIANRHDGFGERLRAMINAMVLAKHLQGEFRFTWWGGVWEKMAPWHSVVSVEDTFCHSFIEKHYVSSAQCDELRVLPLRGSATSMQDFRKAQNKSDGFTVSQVRIKWQAPFLPEGFPSAQENKAAFDTIRFSEPLEEARRLAETIAIDEQRAIGVHLRAGDLMYGPFRCVSRYHRKACPYPFAEKVVADLVSAGGQVILFAQDEQFASYLGERYQVLNARLCSLDNAFDTAQAALFDICLMSRCARLLCCNSGFSVLAAWLGGVAPENPYALYGKEVIQRLLDEAIMSERVDERISVHQIAFASWFSLLLSGRCLAELEPDNPALTRAISCDAENHLFRIVQVCALHNSGDSKGAERVLYDCFRAAETLDYSIVDILRRVNPDATLEVEAYLPTFEQFAKQGYPFSALCTALAMEAKGETEKSHYYRQQFLTHCPEKGVAILQKL